MAVAAGHIGYTYTCREIYIGSLRVLVPLFHSCAQNACLSSIVKKKKKVNLPDDQC